MDFPRYWRRVRARTGRVVELIPDSAADWSPAPGAMTFGDLVRHLAVTERWLFVEVACGRQTQYRAHGPEIAPTLAESRAVMARLHADSLGLLDGFRGEDWERAITTPGGRSTTAGQWLRAMVEHEAHHRGQLYLMLRMQGISTPSLFGMTSEEVRARADEPSPV